MQIPTHGPNESEIRSLAFSALDFTIRKIGQQGWISNKKLKTVKGGSTVRFIYIYEVYTRTHARLQYIYICFAAKRSSRCKHRAVIRIHTVSVVHTDVGPRAVVIVLSADGEVVEGEFYEVAVGNSDFPHTVGVAGVLQRVGRRRERSLARRQRL